MGHEPQPDREPEYGPEDLEESGGEAELEELPLAASLSPSPETGRSLIGQTLEARYRFDELLGEGSFSRVYKVYDMHRQVYLAAKVLRSDIAQEPAFLERFKREAVVLERLQHPNIVRYYDTVESGDYVFILTDYIAGRTLQSVLRRRAEPFNPLDSLKILRPLAAALYYAHREDIVHRDLKPANILLDANDNVYVTDFGIARIITDTSTLTVDTTVGTPHFMSPEQIMVGTIGQATDVYALGVLLYQMYTRELPFTGDSPNATGTTSTMRIVYEHLHVRPRPPSELNPRISRAIDSVILRCLEKDPTQRYQTVNQVYVALNDAIGTPSVALDAGELAGVVSEGTAAIPEAERVPTSAGGMSRVVAEDDMVFGDMPGDYDDDDFADGDMWGQKHKRGGMRERQTQRKSKSDAWMGDVDWSDEMTEKEREKKAESEEKADEKQAEKGWDAGIEKNEMLIDLGPSDRLSQFTFGGSVLWAGLVFLMDFSEPGGWIAGGIGGLLVLESAVRMILPEYRARPGGRLVLGAGLLTVGLGLGLGFANWWALALIVIGISLLINRLFD